MFVVLFIIGVMLIAASLIASLLGIPDIKNKTVSRCVRCAVALAGIGLLWWLYSIPPITIRLRPSVWGNHYVCIVENTSNKTLKCHCKFRDPNSGQSGSYRWMMSPYAKVEIGMMQCGYNFDPGDELYIKVDGYRETFYRIKTPNGGLFNSPYVSQEL